MKRLSVKKASDFKKKCIFSLSTTNNLILSATISTECRGKQMNPRSDTVKGDIAGNGLLKAELARAGCYLADLVCHFTSNDDGFYPEFCCRNPELSGCPTLPEQIFDWFVSALHADDEAVFRDIVRRVLEGSNICAEIRLANQAGEYVLYRVIGRPLLDENNRVTSGVIAFNHWNREGKDAVITNNETILDSFLACYVVLDKTGAIELATEIAANLLGTPAASLIGSQLSSYFVDDIGELLQTDTDGIHEADVELKTVKDVRRWAQVCVTRIRRTHETDGSRLVILRDVSERKRAELQLAQSEEKFRSLAENLPNVVCIIADGRIVYTNSSADSIIGYEAAEMLRDEFDFSSIFNLADPGHFLVTLENELQQQGKVEREVSVRKKDQTVLRCLVSLQYINFDNTRAVLCIITDVTSLYQAIDSLDETKKRYWALFEASSDAILIETLDGRIYDCNSASERIYGYTRPELLGKFARDLVPGDLSGMLKDLEKELAAKRGSDRSICLEALGVRCDGSIFPTEVTINPVKLEGLECFLVTVRDISARREAEAARQRYEKQLLQIQKLDNLGMMANGLANDFNNLLTGIMGYSDLMQRDLQAKPGAREKARRIIEAARRAGEIIHQLMAYTGKLPSMFQKTSISQLIREMQSQLDILVGDSIVLKYELSEDGKALYVDPPMFKQALFCLVKNAVEAVADKKSGILTISVAPGDTSFTGGEAGYFGPPLTAGNYLRVTVADNGCGIDPSQLLRIFDPFYTTKHAGRGLGLSSVLGMLRGHRGSALVEPDNEGGTRFSIFLPYETTAETKSVSAEIPVVSPPSRFTAGKILVVDDEESVRDILAELLRELGYEPVLAENGAQGIELFKAMNESLAVAIIDLTMPEMSGTEVVRTIRWLNPEIPVILCTGLLLDDKKRELEKLGVAAFLEKPFTKNELEKAFVKVKLKTNLK